MIPAVAIGVGSAAALLLFNGCSAADRNAKEIRSLFLKWGIPPERLEQYASIALKNGWTAKKILACKKHFDSYVHKTGTPVIMGIVCNESDKGSIAGTSIIDLRKWNRFKIELNLSSDVRGYNTNDICGVCIHECRHIEFYKYLKNYNLDEFTSYSQYVPEDRTSYSDNLDSIEQQIRFIKSSLCKIYLAEWEGKERPEQIQIKLAFMKYCLGQDFERNCLELFVWIKATKYEQGYLLNDLIDHQKYLSKIILNQSPTKQELIYAMQDLAFYKVVLEELNIPANSSPIIFEFNNLYVRYNENYYYKKTYEFYKNLAVAYKELCPNIV
jgi:hypothetical protein